MHISFGEEDGELQATSEQSTTRVDDTGLSSTDLTSEASVRVFPLVSSTATPWAKDHTGVSIQDQGISYFAQPELSGVSIYAIVHDGSRHEVRYDLQLSSGFLLAPDPEDESIDIVDATGHAVGRIEAPWARDADGNPVATHYSLRGNTLIQHIKVGPDTEYPVVADPKFTWGRITGTIYFNKPETADIASLGALSAACSWAAAIAALATVSSGGVAAPVGAAIAAACATQWAIWVTTATLAKNRGECVKVKYGLGYSVQQMQLYSGGYCTK